MHLILDNFNNIGNALGWALIHFLWQGTLIFIAYWMLTRTLLKDSINAQYWLGMISIIMCLAIPINEFITQLSSPNNSSIVHSLNLSIISISNDGILNNSDLIVSLIQKIIPYLVLIWATVVFLISTHLIKSWFSLVRLSKDSAMIIPENLQRKLLSATEKLKLKFKPIITISKKIDIPATFGFFKPVILLPASLMSKLPQDQMEAILLHELCHIKRSDFLHNIIQLIVETLFFYHPLTKWISQDVRKIREKCCDNLVLSLDTKPMLYANALTNIATIFNESYKKDSSSSHLQIAANDGELFNRIQFLMLEKRATSPIFNILIGVLLSFLILITFKNIIESDSVLTSPLSKSGINIFNSKTSKLENRPIYINPSIDLISSQNKIALKTPENIFVKSTPSPIALNKKETLLNAKPITNQSVPIIDPNTEIQIITKKNLTELFSSTPPNNKEHSSAPLKQSKTTTKVTKSNTFPRVIKKVNPRYSRLAQSRGIEGDVILSFNIDHNGRVKNITVDKSSPLKLLDGNARSALKKWRFDQKSITKLNINNRYQQIFNFNLNKAEVCITGNLGSRLNSNKVCKE